MNILRKLGIRRILSDKTSSFLTVLGIILSVSLITMVVTTSSAIYQIASRAEINSVGLQNLDFMTTSPNEALASLDSVEASLIMTTEGYFNNPRSEGGFYPQSVNGFDIEKRRMFIPKRDQEESLKLIEGRFAENSDEVTLSYDLFPLNNPFKIGDTLEVYRSITQDYEIDFNSEKRVLTIVGIMKNSNHTVHTVPTDNFDKAQVFVKFFDNTKNYKEQRDIAKSFALTNTSRGQLDYYLFENGQRNDIIGFSDSINYLKLSIQSIASVFLVIVSLASIFIIYNSLNVSLDQRIHQSGLIRSVGTTKKQLKKIVNTEGSILTIFGLLGGMILGLSLTFFLFNIIKGNFSTTDAMGSVDWHFKLPLNVLLIISLVTIIVVAIPLRKSLKKLFSLTSIEAIRKHNRFDGSETRSVKTRKKTANITSGLAKYNMKRDKRKYRASIVALIISMVVLVTTSSFISLIGDLIEIEHKISKYNIVIENRGTLTLFKEEMAELFKESPEIKESIIMRTFTSEAMNEDLSDLKINPVFKNIVVEQLRNIVDLRVVDDEQYLELANQLDYKVDLNELIVVNWYEGFQEGFISSEFVTLNEKDILKLGGYIRANTPNITVGKIIREMPESLDIFVSAAPGLQLILSDSIYENYASQYDAYLEHVDEITDEAGYSASLGNPFTQMYITSDDTVKTIKTIKDHLKEMPLSQISDYLDYEDSKYVLQVLMKSFYQVTSVFVIIVIFMSISNVVNITITNAAKEDKSLRFINLSE